MHQDWQDIETDKTGPGSCCFPHNTRSLPPLHWVICACGRTRALSASFQQAWPDAFLQLWSSGTVLEHAQLVGTCRHSTHGTAQPISHSPRVALLQLQTLTCTSAPAQSDLQAQRGVVATTQPPFWLPTSRIPALQQHLHVVYISMQIFRLWFVTWRMTPRCSAGKAKQGPGKMSKTPPGPSRTMTKLWDILSPNNGNLLGFCHRIVGFFFSSHFE